MDWIKLDKDKVEADFSAPTRVFRKIIQNYVNQIFYFPNPRFLG
jgi:hypothetical protein